MKYYYGLINGSYGFTDKKSEGLIEITEDEHKKLLEEQSKGNEIVYYNGKVFTAPIGLYYVDDNKHWQKNDENKYKQEQLKKAKELKYAEACSKAYSYLNEGKGLYELNILSNIEEEETYHIEATDGNIAKITAYTLAYVTGQLQDNDIVIWNTKEDVTIELSRTQIIQILKGLGEVQALVWNVKFPTFVSLIKQATSISDINSINIDYSDIQEEDKEQQEYYSGGENG